MIEEEVVNKVTQMKLVLFSIHIMLEHLNLFTELMCLLNIVNLLNIFYLENNENSSDADCYEDTTCHGKTTRGEAKTEQGERFWEVVKEQTGQDLEALKICGLLPTERNTKVTCVGVHLVSTQVCLHICLCVCANSAKAYYC